MRPAWAIRLAALSAFAVALQWGAGAYEGESWDPDEPAHLVTGLMVRDYLTSGLGRGPIEFARDYYLHYPKVAIGHWPPVYYLEQAMWTLVFPASRQSLLVMIALQSALLGTLVWPFLRDRFGSTAAWVGGLVLATLPGLATHAAMVMTEIPQALLILLAILAWGRFLDTGRGWHAVAFGLWSAAAILAKGTGVVLAGVPLLSVWMGGRADLLRRAWFWMPAAIVLLVCTPWYLMAPGAMHERVAAYGGIGFANRRLRFPLLPWAEQFGWVVAMLAVAGLAILLYRRVTGHTLEGAWASATALAITASVFPMFIRAWESRHVVESTPAFLFLAAAGTGWIASCLKPRLAVPHKMAILALAALLTMSWNLSRLPRQRPPGYRPLVAAIFDGSFGPARAILVSGDALAEGALISEAAQRERHPKRYIVRSSKLFAEIQWMGRLMRMKVSSAGQVNALLTSLPVDLVVIDRVAPAPYAYQPLLEEALAAHPGEWQPAEHATQGERFAIFRRIGGPTLSSPQMEAQLKAALPDPVP